MILEIDPGVSFLNYKMRKMNFLLDPTGTFSSVIIPWFSQPVNHFTEVTELFLLVTIYNPGNANIS